MSKTVSNICACAVYILYIGNCTYIRYCVLCTYLHTSTVLHAIGMGSPPYSRAPPYSWAPPHSGPKLIQGPTIFPGPFWFPARSPKHVGFAQSQACSSRFLLCVFSSNFRFGQQLNLIFNTRWNILYCYIKRSIETDLKKDMSTFKEEKNLRRACSAVSGAWGYQILWIRRLY